MNQARTMQNIPQLVCVHYNGPGMKIIECSMFYNVAHLFTWPSGRVVTKCGVPVLIALSIISPALKGDYHRQSRRRLLTGTWTFPTSCNAIRSILKGDVLVQRKWRSGNFVSRRQGGDGTTEAYQCDVSDNIRWKWKVISGRIIVTSPSSQTACGYFTTTVTRTYI